MKKIILLSVLFLFLLSIYASAEMCEVAHVRTNLKKMLFEYFESPSTAQVELGKVKDLLDFYLQIPTDEIEANCSGVGTNSNVAYSIIVDEGDTVTTAIPYCADGTEFGTCSETKPKYCYNGRLIDRCSICECSSGECQEDGNCLIPDDNEFECIDLDGGKDYFTKSYATWGNETFNQTQYDVCTDDTPGANLIEGICYDGPKGFPYMCPNGCQDGVCINETSFCGDGTCDADENCLTCETDCSCSPSYCQENGECYPGCIDTDPTNMTIYDRLSTPGTCTFDNHRTVICMDTGFCTEEDGVYEDRCNVNNDSFIIDYYCSPTMDNPTDQYCSGSTTHNCQQYGFDRCENGACVMETNQTSYCGDGTCDDDESCSSCESDCGICPEGYCEDSDGGNVSTVYGYTRQVFQGGWIENYDHCTTNLLYEAVCRENWTRAVETINCNNYNMACYNGKCIPSETDCIAGWTCLTENQLVNINSNCDYISSPQYCTGGCINGTCPNETSYCGDGNCDATEGCYNCESDCGVCPFCGDGICNAFDNCSNCEIDCGICPEDLPGDNCTTYISLLRCDYNNLVNLSVTSCGNQTDTIMDCGSLTCFENGSSAECIN